MQSAPMGNGMVTCPRCGTPTPSAFAYCQQCGLHMQAIAPTDPGPRSIGGGPMPMAGLSPAMGTPVMPQPMPGPMGAPVDPQGATMAQTGPDAIRAGSIARPGPSSSPPIAAAVGVAWGTAVLVNRDGSDGERFPLVAEYAIVGRAGADIAFPDDRFLARQHARLERGDGGARVHPLDALNGVFRKADAPVELVDGSIVLVGREVLRFELVEAEERTVQPLVRHGVALFGSPPREPWARLVQIVPSGGWRDLRHLATEEIVLGREEGDSVYRDDAFMSRRHAAINWDGRRAMITDLGSSNGTFVRITGPVAVKHGDHLRMGDQLLRIEIGR